MSGQARKVFNIEEQKAKDVLAAIKAIVPVISLIREWGKVEEEYVQISEGNEKLSKEIESIEHVIGLAFSEGQLKKDLSKILEEKSSKYKVDTKKEEELKSICDNMEREVVSYQNYAENFDWIGKSILEILLELETFDKEEFLSMIFLLLNAKVSQEALRIIPYKYSNHIQEYKINALISSFGWNIMLDKLKENKL